jgi:hypothetical protein
MQVPLRSSRVEIFNQFTAEHLATGQYSGNAFSGKLVLSIDAFSANHALFVKLDRRGWFFDEAGWLELPAAVHSELVVADACTAEQPWVPGEKIDNVVALE